jgi:hypothetical protein
MGVADPFFHIYSGVLIVLVGFVLLEVWRIRKNSDHR